MSGQDWICLLVLPPVAASFFLGMSKASIWGKHLGSLALGLVVGFAAWPAHSSSDMGLTPFFWWFILCPLLCRFAAYCGQGIRRRLDRPAKPDEEEHKDG